MVGIQGNALGISCLYSCSQNGPSELSHIQLRVLSLRLDSHWVQAALRDVVCLRPGSSLKARALNIPQLAFLAAGAHTCLTPKEKMQVKHGSPLCRSVFLRCITSSPSLQPEEVYPAYFLQQMWLLLPFFFGSSIIHGHRLLLTCFMYMSSQASRKHILVLPLCSS